MNEEADRGWTAIHARHAAEDAARRITLDDALRTDRTRKRHRDVLASLTADGPATARELGARLGISRGTARAAGNALCARGAAEVRQRRKGLCAENVFHAREGA